MSLESSNQTNPNVIENNNNEHIINVTTTPISNITINTPITPNKNKRSIRHVNNTDSSNLDSIKKNLFFSPFDKTNKNK
jgi:hypothetical protein